MKIILICTILTVLNLSTQAQKGIVVGINGSYNTTWIQYQDLYGEINDNGISRQLEYKLTLGPSFGFEAGYMFNSKMGLLVKPAYSMQGQDYKATFIGYIITRSVKLTYIKLPLVYKYVTGDSLYKFYVGGGFEYNLLNTADITAHYNGISDNGNHSNADAMKRFMAYDPAFVFIIGGQFKIIKTLYGDAGLRADYSLLDINAGGYHIANNHGAYHPSRNATAGVELGVHYLFPIIKRQHDYKEKRTIIYDGTL